MTNQRYLVSRNKREGWYAGSHGQCFACWLENKTRVSRCKSLKGQHHE